MIFRNAANDDHLHNNKTQNRPTLSIEINRHNVKNDMLKVFSDESILSFNIEVVFKDNMGNVEKGTGSGLIREAFSLFWNEAYDSWMLGVEKRIPFIRHDYQRVQWEAVGRILVAGYQSCQYFPLQLSITFVAYCLFGAAVVTDAMLIDSFKRYVCDTEREVIEKCLKGEIEENDDALLKLLNELECKKVVKKDSIVKIVTKTAHKEIIQRPQYVVESWSFSMKQLKFFFNSVEALDKIYDELIPSNSKAIARIEAEVTCESDRKALKHLKRYIRGLDFAKLSQFFLFVSGQSCFYSQHC